MTLYSYSLLPVVAVSLLLFFTVALRLRGPLGLAAYTGSVAFWSLTLFFALSPSEFLSEWGLRVAASGAFVVASYLHVAFNLTNQRRYGLVIFAYVVATVITLAGVVFPGLLYDPISLAAGPMFWPSMILAMGASLVPMGYLAWQFGKEKRGSEMSRRIGGLLATGLVGYSGAWTNALLLSHGHLLPYGLFLVLASLLLLALVVQSMQSRTEKKLFERSLVYSALTAFLSAGFLFGALFFLADTTEPVLRDYGLSALFLFAMAALGLEPVRQWTQEYLGRRFAGTRLQAGEMAEALAVQEARADQAERLAMLGTFTSAIAHEVRNPLGVLAAYLKILKSEGVEEETLQDMQAEIDRASHFLDDLLRFGRPRPLELQEVPLEDTIALAISSVRGARSEVLTPGLEIVDVSPEPLFVEADQAQLTQLLIILIDNALLALVGRDGPEGRRIEICASRSGGWFELVVDDNGPGIDSALRDRLFEPFVTGRKREGPGQGTGLGLAIASSIANRHGALLTAEESPLGGARFWLRKPR